MAKKNSSKLRFLIVLPFAVLLFSACSRRGCTDPDGENYEPNAKASCSCCYYYGKFYIWYDEQYLRDKLFQKHTFLKFYIDGEFAGQTTKDLASFSGDAPNIGGRYSYHTPEEESNVIVESLGAEKKKNFELIVKDETNTLLWVGVVTCVADKITPVQIK